MIGQEPTRIFIHGLESSNQGTKAKFFRERYPDMLIPNFPGSLEERMQKLRSELEGKSDIILVGSSFGGLMATIYAMENEERIKRLVLLAPALLMMEKTPYKPHPIGISVWIYHGSHDELLPAEETKKWALNWFKKLNFELVDDDHMLHKSFRQIDWDSLLS